MKNHARLIIYFICMGRWLFSPFMATLFFFFAHVNSLHFSLLQMCDTHIFFPNIWEEARTESCMDYVLWKMSKFLYGREIRMGVNLPYISDWRSFVVATLKSAMKFMNTHNSHSFSRAWHRHIIFNHFESEREQKKGKNSLSIKEHFSTMARNKLWILSMTSRERGCWRMSHGVGRFMTQVRGQKWCFSYCFDTQWLIAMIFTLTHLRYPQQTTIHPIHCRRMYSRACWGSDELFLAQFCRLCHYRTWQTPDEALKVDYIQFSINSSHNEFISLTLNLLIICSSATSSSFLVEFHIFIYIKFYLILPRNFFLIFF